MADVEVEEIEEEEQKQAAPASATLTSDQPTSLPSLKAPKPTAEQIAARRQRSLKQRKSILEKVLSTVFFLQAA